ncbi:MAG: FAD/NAD(P)-binding protein [Ilumatobacteraceae bacterium]
MPAVVAPLALAVVGAGPTASSLLERLVANVPELLADRPLVVHLIDPHRAGTGRVWRPDLDPLLWMNSMAEDVTMFTDASVHCAGPIRPGPSLYEWSQDIDDEALAELAPPALAAEIRGLSGMTFPTRLVQSVYLEWYHRRVLAALPPGVEVVAHDRRAVDLRDGPDGRQWVTLDGEDEPLRVDVVVLAMGHLDAEPRRADQVIGAFAEEHGLVYLPAGHTAELDLSGLQPGADVITVGFGQAFTDLLILVTEGRGGRFVELADGSLRYEPSGREPVLHVGSRRGVPYRSKLDYRLQGPRPAFPRFLDDAGIEALLAGDAPVEFHRDVLPVLLKEIGWATYHELFLAHPERVDVPWEVFAERFAAVTARDELDAVVAELVPDPVDRFDLEALDHPLAGLRFGSAVELHAHVAGHVAGDVARRTDPTYSGDLGAFMAMLLSFGPLGKIAASGRMSTRSRVEDLGRWWFSFFMYYASGPPPDRLRQFLALADAGLLHFVGADITVTTDAGRGRFVAHSASHPDDIVGTALVDARIAGPSLRRTTDVLLQRLRDRGEAHEEVVTDGDWSVNTGKVVVTGADLRLAGADGTGHPRRHALGVFTNRPAAGAFARPGTNAPAFRQNDLVARSILDTLAGIDLAPSASSTGGSTRLAS